jgi:hypothetical protein
MFKRLDPACGLAGKPARLGHGTWRSPASFRLKHRIEGEEPLVHCGDQRNFGRFTARAQALIKRS